METNTYTPWRELLGDGLTNLQDALRPPFERVSRVRAYSSWLVPGMLQTRAYMEAIFASVQDERGISDEDVQGAVESRLGRQPLAFVADKEYEFLIEESSLRNGVGGAGAMREQLLHVADLIASGRPTIGILPISVNRNRWPEASFWIYGGEYVNIELVSGSVDLRHPVEVAEYAARFSQLATDAVYGSVAHSLVSEIVESLGESR